MSTIKGAVLSAMLMAGVAVAAEPYKWTLPVYLAEGLKVTMETKATEDLMKRAAVQCIDAECKQQVAKCQADLANCVLVPSPEAVRENENENN
jgi:acyl dehydratase